LNSSPYSLNLASKSSSDSNFVMFFGCSSVQLRIAITEVRHSAISSTCGSALSRVQAARYALAA